MLLIKFLASLTSHYESRLGETLLHFNFIPLSFSFVKDPGYLRREFAQRADETSFLDLFQTSCSTTILFLNRKFISTIGLVSFSCFQYS